MPNDPFNLPQIYPTKRTAGVTGTGTGFVYYQSSDITDDSHFSDEGHVSNSSNFEWTMKTSGPDAVQISKNGFSVNDIGGCDNKFSDNVDRGYAYKADDPRDIELTIVVKFVDSGSDNGFAIEGPTGAHSSSGCCSGNCYKFDIQYRKNPVIFRWRKEMWHVDNSDDPVTGQWTDSHFNFALLGRSKWTGFKYIRYNKAGGAKSGHNTPDSVVLEVWANTDVDANPSGGWFLLKRTEDRGGWGDSGDQCDGDKDQIGVWSNIRFRLKSNDESGEFKFKYLSLREIDPTLSFGDVDPTDQGGSNTDNPNDIPTQVTGALVVRFDINEYGTSQCAGTGVGSGGGGETGNARFYSVYNTQGIGDSDKELSDSTAFQHRIRIGMSPINSSSVFNNKLPNQVDIPIKKVGSPGSGNTVKCKIYSATNAIIYTSPTQIDPTTLTTSYVKKIFDFSTNTHVLRVGDWIGVNYDGTSDTNYVVVSYFGTAYPNTNYGQYESDVWQIKTRRLVMDVWE